MGEGRIVLDANGQNSQTTWAKVFEVKVQQHLAARLGVKLLQPVAASPEVLRVRTWHSCGTYGQKRPSRVTDTAGLF